VNDPLAVLRPDPKDPEGFQPSFFFDCVQLDYDPC
jgi:hypothetical protein